MPKFCMRGLENVILYGGIRNVFYGICGIKNAIFCSEKVFKIIFFIPYPQYYIIRMTTLIKSSLSVLFCKRLLIAHTMMRNIHACMTSANSWWALVCVSMP